MFSVLSDAISMATTWYFIIPRYVDLAVVDPSESAWAKTFSLSDMRLMPLDAGVSLLLNQVR